MKTTIQKHAHNIAGLSTIGALLAPLLVSAQDIQSIIAVADNILRLVIPVLMVLATVVFLWGVITYLTAGGDEEKTKSGRHFMIWGIVALFVMVVVWGLVLVLEQTFGITRAPIPTGPQ